jgi:hypothetical protein
MRMKTTEMKRTWLIQRLRPPMRQRNPFAFGGGKVNGGLSANAMDLLMSAFSFDYMGAAEYEWGAVPEALEEMVKADLLAWRTDVQCCQDCEPKIVYVLGPKGWRDEIDTRIQTWGQEKYNRDIRDSTLLYRTLFDDEQAEWLPVGWLELDNGFAFFTDAEMWGNVATLFGVEVNGD